MGRKKSMTAVLNRTNELPVETAGTSLPESGADIAPTFEPGYDPAAQRAEFERLSRAHLERKEWGINEVLASRDERAERAAGGLAIASSPFPRY